MSRHEGVSCDACLKTNFRGRRYKCLICYDYDLCAECYESGASTARHTTEHAVQCILTRTDYELFYGGETSTGEQHSYTCPYCGRRGWTEQGLHEHAVQEHAEASTEVVCPVCAAQSTGDPNLVTEDLAGHLALEHRNPAKDLISFLEEPGGRRRIPGPVCRAVAGRRSSGALVEGVDPIAELLSQLSGGSRVQGPLTSEQVRAHRRPPAKLPPVPASTSQITVEDPPPRQVHRLVLDRASLLPRHSQLQMEAEERERADRSLFVQHLILATLSQHPLLDSEQNIPPL